MTPTVDRYRMVETVRHLQGMGNRRSNEKQWEAARWIDSRFKSFGLNSKIQTYDFRGKEWPNVVAVIRGKKAPLKIVIAIAHLDSISDNAEGVAPGADDNGSGVAAIFEIARVLKDGSPDKTLYLCVFSNEEVGSPGSGHFARVARAEGKDIEAVVNLDVLAYNKPHTVRMIEALSAHATLKRKAKSLWRMGRNYLYGNIYGDNAIKVVGKKTEGALVHRVGTQMRRTAGLNIQEVVRDDCG